jgi:GNAT superfamily N-acetyltransferase
MSLYGDYIKEREGKEIIEDHRGFASFSFMQDVVMINDLYVVPQYRQNKVGSEFANKIVDLAKQKGCKFMYCTVDINTNGSSESMAAILAYGFKLDQYINNLILLKRSI